MARKAPNYRRHKASGRAVLQWKPLERLIGKSEVYLNGEYGSPECLAHYAELLKLIAAAKPLTPAEAQKIKSAGFCISDLVVEYRKAKGKATTNMKQASTYLNDMRGTVLLSEFGPLALQEFRDELITPDRTANYINQLVTRVRQLFKWGVAREMLSAERYAALTLVEGLKPGESGLRVSKKVRPVAWKHVEALLTKVTPCVAAMIQIHGLTGMRSGELTGLRESELDRTHDVWIYRKEKHKTSHRGKEKAICLGPRAQALLLPYLSSGREFVFSPIVAEQERNSARAAARKTPLYGKARIRKPSCRSKSIRYTSRVYYRTLRYAFVSLANERMRTKSAAPNYVHEKPPNGCDLRAWLKARGVIYFHPHQLRHARATDTADAFGVEAAQTQLGNTLQATQIYAEKSLRIAMEVSRQTG